MANTKQYPTPLEKLYHWEKVKAGDIYMVQPMGGGQYEEYTWKRAAGEVRRMAAYLRSLDLPPNSQIAILSKNCAHWIMSDLAIWMAGHISVPLYPTLNAESIRQILDHSESKAIFIGKLDGWEGMKDGVPDDLHKISYPLSPPNDFPTWNDIIKEHAPVEDSPTRAPEELATLVYTSGSTGMPKGVMLSFFNLAYAAENGAPQLNVTDKDRMLSYLPLSHVFERWVVEMTSLYTGFKIFFAESLDTFVQDLNYAKPTMFVAVPRIWAKFQLGVFEKLPQKKLDFLLKVPVLSGVIKKKVLTGLGLQHCRFAGSGSAPLSADILNWYRKLGLELLEGYGMSENFGYSHTTQMGRSRLGYVGEPLPGVEVRLGDGREVQVKSPATMMGYFKADDKTSEAMTDDGFLRTGDVGEIDEQGRLKLTGRIKEIFKTGKGKYVAPAPIENRLMSSSLIEMVCVSGSGYPQPMCLVVLSEDAAKSRQDPQKKKEVEDGLKEVLQELNRELNEHEKLGFLAVVKEEWTIENTLLTPTMKLKRNAIEGEYQDKYDTWYAQKQPVIWE